MRTRTTRDFPAGLTGIHHRFERWRWTRQGRSRIPERLWASAVKAAAKYGLHRTSRALGLDYNSLKKRVEIATSRTGCEREDMARFIELASPVSAGSPECILELEGPRGAKMRVHLKGMPAPDLTALSRSFWSMEP